MTTKNKDLMGTVGARVGSIACKRSVSSTAHDLFTHHQHGSPSPLAFDFSESVDTDEPGEGVDENDADTGEVDRKSVAKSFVNGSVPFNHMKTFDEEIASNNENSHLEWVHFEIGNQLKNVRFQSAKDEIADFFEYVASSIRSNEIDTSSEDFATLREVADKLALKRLTDPRVNCLSEATEMYSFNSLKSVDQLLDEYIGYVDAIKDGVVYVTLIHEDGTTFDCTKPISEFTDITPRAGMYFDCTTHRRPDGEEYVRISERITQPIGNAVRSQIEKMLVEAFGRPEED